MELRNFSDTGIKVTPIGLGTWVMGGWMWGGADEQDSIGAITTSLELGVNLIDTAPVYGFGKAEEIVGKALKKINRRKDIIIATKCGLEWDANEKIRLNSSKKRILQEIGDSLKRLQTDYIDIYQIHWPDPNASMKEAMETLASLYKKGVIRAIGVSNFSVDQMKKAMSYGKLHSLQPPYNMLEREIETDILPFCIDNNLATLTYGALCRGLLTGKFSKSDTFKTGDLRKTDPKFRGEQFGQYINAIEKLKIMAENKNTTVSQLALEWVINQPGVTCALVGARTENQAQSNCKAIHEKYFTADELKQAKNITAGI